MSLPPPGPFTELPLDFEYETPRALPAFYVPVLSRALRYDRTCGYFRASSLAVAAQGVARFLAHGGTMRLLCGVELLEEDANALLGDAPLTAAVEDRLRASLATSDDIEQHRLGVLAWLVREGRLQIQLAVPRAPGSNAYFHEKAALFEDAHGNSVCINGSNNESSTGWQHNFESFWVRASWKDSADAMESAIATLRRRFEGDLPGFRRLDLPAAIAAELVKYAPSDPPTRDIAEPAARPAASSVARVLQLAPRLSNGRSTLAATSAVRPFPHQAENVERLAGTYPRSWLLADEVGLGKTISAGLALRQLLLGRRVRRALVLAPANVCIQWQDELFEKFGLWIPRYADQKLYGVHPDDVTAVPVAANAYAEHPVLLVSSHLARLDAQRRKLLDSPPYDLIVVDEAHHARRRGADPSKREPTKLLRLLDEIRSKAHARALWLLTATPMQVHPVELYDLIEPIAESEAVAGAGYGEFERYYRQLAQPPSAISWSYLGRRAARLPAELDPAEERMLERIEERVGAYVADRIRKFGHGDAAAQAAELSPDGRNELLAFLRQRGPIARCVVRHGRGTLRRYREQGLLKEPIATRSVTVRPVELSAEESSLYAGLDDLIDRLNAAHGTTQAAGFILTTYRRRLTSSWAAIYASLRRRVEAEAAVGEAGEPPDGISDDELAEDDPDGVAGEPDPQVLPLSDGELDEMRAFVDRLEAMTTQDAKLSELLADVDTARKTGAPLIVFTQYTDTLNHLRDRLMAYGPELATYTGAGGRWFGKPEGQERCTKQELVDAVRSGGITVLLCTDAASEGLNLQAASTLVNYDLPWNPMRVEQRIGRIDRIGQPAPVVQILNYTIPGTVEEDVYRALAERIDIFDGLVGELQPILGAVESSFKAVYRSPRSERATTLRAELAELDTRQRELDHGGIRYEESDALWPVPEAPEPAVDLDALVNVLRDDLQIDLGSLTHATTAEPTRASRDASGWRALATLGHTELDACIDRAAAAGSPAALLAAEAETAAALVRADRSPPELITTLAELEVFGEPASTEDAQALADASVREAVERHEAAIRRWDALRLDRERGVLRRELQRRVHRLLSLQALETGARPVEELWSALIVRPSPKVCGDLPTLLERAGLSPREVVRGYAPEQLETAGANQLAREASGLKDWWQRWQAVNGAGCP